MAVFLPARPSLSAAPGIADRRDPRRLPLTARLPASEIEAIAATTGIPVEHIPRLRAPALVDVIERLAPDLIVTSCFPWRVPGEIRSLARLGALNLHPSLLPRFRGPEPIFWVYRCAAAETGVTIHLMADRFDAGPIVAQRPFRIIDDTPGDVLERRCAIQGGQLLVDAIEQIRSGQSHPQTQDESQASYQSWPTWRDRVLDPGWSVQRARNFIRGVLPLGYPPLVRLGGQTLEVAGLVDRPGATRTVHAGASPIAVIAVPVADGEVLVQVRSAAALSGEAGSGQDTEAESEEEPSRDRQ